MKKITIVTLTALMLGVTQAEYTIKLQPIDREFIKFVNFAGATTPPNPSPEPEPEPEIPLKPIEEKECLYGSSSTTSSWRQVGGAKKSSGAVTYYNEFLIIWKGTNLGAINQAGTTYSLDGYKYTRSGSYKIYTAKCTSASCSPVTYWYLFEVCREPI